MKKDFCITCLCFLTLLLSCSEKKQYSITGYWSIQKFEVTDPSKLSEEEQLEIEHSKDLLERMEIELLNNNTFKNHLGGDFIIPGIYEYKPGEKILIMNPGQTNEERYTVQLLNDSTLHLKKADQPLLLLFKKEIK